MIKMAVFACSQENVKNVVFFEEFLLYHIVIINFYFVFSAIERQKNKLVELFFNNIILGSGCEHSNGIYLFLTGEFICQRKLLSTKTK